MSATAWDTGFRPLLKWPGGKSREWARIQPHLPAEIRHVVDPFMGGLAPFALTPFSGNAFLNDRHPRLVDLHRGVQAQDAALFAALDRTAHDWDALGPLATSTEDGFLELVTTARAGERPDAIALAREHAGGTALEPFLARSLANKALRVARLETKHDVTFDDAQCAEHGETAVRAAYYTLVREREHGAEGPQATADFLFVRETCYGSMFRTNAEGRFNIPYGGRSYNRKSIARRVEQLRSSTVADALSRATFSCGDFADFLDALPVTLDERDFVFVDPPYLSDFSTYGPNAFSVADHERLADRLAGARAHWLLVIKETPDVRRIYVDGAPGRAGAREVETFGKQYGYNVRGRNVRGTRHLMLAGGG